ncbi:MAG: ABC transporter substrate-binding protein [bacterium]
MKKWFVIGLAMVSLLLGFSSSTFAEEPQYGGDLKMFIRPTINPFTWDAHDWGWKLNEDTGLVYEHLLVGDLQKGPRGSNVYSFEGDAWVPPNAVRGELAKSWELKQDPLRLEFQLREGVFWQARKGVMDSREFVAEDVVYFFNRVRSSKKYIPTYWDFIDRWEAKGKYTVICYLNEYNANWQYRFGWGYYNAISPKEVVEAGPRDWRNITGTGPYSLEKYQTGSYQHYVKNPNYWDSTVIDGKSYKLPFTDSIRYILNKDEQSRMSALRTAKVDLMTGIRWNFARELKQQVPELKWSRRAYDSPPLFVMRMDTKPFDDIRVRRAMALAINQEEIRDNYWGGEAQLFAYPYSPAWTGYYVPLDKQPQDVQELYGYNPEKAKKLLTEAGYPNGFTVKAQVNSSYQPFMDQAQLVVGYLAKVGVTLVLEPMEYRQVMGVMIKKAHGPAYFLGSGQGNPIMSLRKNFVTGQTWNAYMMADKDFDAKWNKALRTVDETEQVQLLQELVTDALQKVPFVQMPANYFYTAWWPWVKNVHGDSYVGALLFGPIHARYWIDQKLKKQMGH